MSLNHLNTISNYLQNRGLLLSPVCIDIINSLKNTYNDLNETNLASVCFSNFARNAIRKYPQILDKGFDFSSILDDINAFDIEQTNFETSLDNFLKLLRKHKQQIYSRIAINILTGYFNFQQIVNLQSKAADVFINKAFIYSCNLIKKKYKHDIENNLIIYGMGKLGAKELNFSSDVDLIILCTNEEVKEHAQELARLLLKILSESTEDGFVLRVDYELRPGGNTAQLVCSTNEAYSYYEGWGHTWERLAWIKARFICGNKQSALTFLKELRPFVFRRFLDYSTIEEVRSIKKLMKYQAQSKIADYNLKMSEGGIREIEFCVISMFLIYSGRFTDLQEYGLDFISILENLQKIKVINKKEAVILKENYIFLRKMEHILQCFDDRQTYSVDKKQLERLLFTYHTNKFLNNEDKYIQDFYKIIDWNRSFFVSLFFDDLVPEQNKDEKIIVLGGSNPEREKLIKNAGFKNPEQAIQDIDTINEILNYKYFSVNVKETAFKVQELFIKKIINSSQADNILSKFKQFFNAIKSRPTLFLLLYENKNLIDLFVRLFEGGTYFADMFIHHPEFIDSMLMGGELVNKKGKEGIKQSFQHFCLNKKNKQNSFENKIENMKLFKVYEETRIGSSYLSSLIDVSTVNKELSYIADIIIKELLSIISEDTNGIAVFAMGRLGEKAINFGSDLDLIFIYDDKLYTLENVSKKLQRLITVLSSQSRYGKLYHIDMDLRPSGHSGPLAVTYDSFVKYYTEKNEAWEKIALWKIRYIAGDKELGKKIIKFKRAHLKIIKPNTEMIKNLVFIRSKVLKEHNNSAELTELKYGSGGLLDIEYLGRILQLKNGLISYNNLFYALKKLLYKNVPDAEVLFDALSLYRRIETYVRINAKSDEHKKQEVEITKNKVEQLVQKYLLNGE